MWMKKQTYPPGLYCLETGRLIILDEEEKAIICCNAHCEEGDMDAPIPFGYTDKDQARSAFKAIEAALRAKGELVNI